MTANYYSISQARIRVLALPHVQAELEKQEMVFLRAEVSDNEGLTVFYATRKNLSRIEDYPEKSETKFPIVELTKLYSLSELTVLPEVLSFLIEELKSLGLDLRYPDARWLACNYRRGSFKPYGMELEVVPTPPEAPETE
jgi:hypothetical protein